jgi:hypothetical protein
MSERDRPNATPPRAAPSPASWWRRHPKLFVALLVVVLAAAGGGAYAAWFRPAAPEYVTDGSHVFDANLSGVEGLIHKENDWVSGTGRPYVSVAVLATMSPGPGADADRTRHGVEGAYLAQFEANHPSGPGTRRGAPLVRLLLADEGAQQGTWRQAAAALEASAGTEHLVAVTGLGTGGAATTALARELSGRHIAMVGAVVTDDALAHVTGLVRVAPTDADQARAAVRFMDGNPDPRHPLPATPRVWLVQDQNSGDLAAATLGSVFPQVLTRSGGRHYQIVGPGTEYDSGVPAAATVLRDRHSGDGVCRSRVDVVYVAGGGVGLRGALAGLARRYCARTRHLTVLTGSEAVQLAGHAGLWPDTTANMDVYLTGLAHPDLWRARPEVADPATTAWFGKLAYGFGHMFPTERPTPSAALRDGWAIMFHDSVLTAVDAVHVASPDAAKVPAAAAVADALSQVSAHGASGYLCFDGAGSPIDKAVPVLRLSGGGALTYRAVSAGEGNPAVHPCD